MSGKRAKTLRQEAVIRYHNGESATEICLSLGKSRQWLYKWLQRKEELSQDSSPDRVHNRTPVEIEKCQRLVVLLDVPKKCQRLVDFVSYILT